MKLSTGYRDIFKLSLPIMLGSAVQNIIALTDSVFLYHLDETDFAAMGFVGVYYLIAAGIGYGFSKGGQIIVARRLGQGQYEKIGQTFYSLLAFEGMLATVVFFVLYFLSPYIFATLLDSNDIMERCLDYIRPRSWGVFFSYSGVAMVALYTGIAKTRFIVIDTLILAFSNIVLNYGLIFGHFGLPTLGIAGAGLASTISEAIALVVFAGYVLWDRFSITMHLHRWPKVDFGEMQVMFRMGFPLVVQMLIGLGSWFVFFGLVENLGQRALAITNLGRIVYLILSIPCWGFSSSINTMVSNVIGAGEDDKVIPITWRTVQVSVLFTVLLATPILVFPKVFLYPILGSEDMSLMTEAQPVFNVLMIIVVLFSVGVVLLNGLIGTGRTFIALKLQLFATLIYIGYVFYVVKWNPMGLVWAWSSEVIYWVAMIGLTVYYISKYYGKRRSF